MAGSPLSVLGGIGGGILGEIWGSGPDAQAKKLRGDQLKRWLDLNVPNPEDQKVIYQQYQQTGRLDPEMEQAISQDSSEMGNISQDPRLMQSQMDALGSLQNVASSGGMTMMDKANLQGSLQQGQDQYRGATDRISQSMAERGIGGSGLELAQRMGAAQTQASNANMAGLHAAGDASQRALDALSQGGQLAGNIQTGDFNRKAAQAQAQDAINKFNTQNRQSVQSTNVAAKNSAQKSNLNAQQDIANANVDLNNKAEDHNKGLIQGQYDNQVTKLNGAGGATNSLAADQDAEAELRRKQGAGIGSGLSKLF